MGCEEQWSGMELWGFRISIETGFNLSVLVLYLEPLKNISR